MLMQASGTAFVQCLSPNQFQLNGRCWVDQVCVQVQADASFSQLIWQGSQGWWRVTCLWPWYNGTNPMLVYIISTIT